MNKIIQDHQSIAIDVAKHPDGEYKYIMMFFNHNNPNKHQAQFIVSDPSFLSILKAACMVMQINRDADIDFKHNDINFEELKNNGIIVNDFAYMHYLAGLMDDASVYAPHKMNYVSELFYSSQEL